MFFQMLYYCPNTLSKKSEKIYENNKFYVLRQLYYCPNILAIMGSNESKKVYENSWFYGFLE